MALLLKGKANFLPLKTRPPTLDDIVFRERNRMYGAFVLRRKYRPTLSWIILAVCLICLLLSSVSLIQPRDAGDEEFLQNPYVEYFPMPNDIKPPENFIPEALIKMHKKAPFTIPKVVASWEEETKNQKDENSAEGDTTLNGNSAAGSPEGVLDGSGKNDDAVYTYVEELPSFPGGVKAMNRFLQMNIRYPKLAYDNKIQGVVYCSFIVEKSGELSSLRIIQGVGAGCDEEALRVIGQMPRWSPGRRQGHPVRVVVNLPIRFILQAKS